MTDSGSTTSPGNPCAAMLIVGDEILSGRTRDANMHYLAGELSIHGIDFREARFVPDDHAAIVSAVDQLRITHHHVFTSGGIGPTHDDITADAIADAFGVTVSVHAGARDMLETHYRTSGQTLNRARLRMARIPDGAQLIPNPISGAPGFSLDNVHVMAGVPAIFKAMLEVLLATIPRGVALASRSMRIMCAEGDLAGILASVARSHPDVSIGSYPFRKADQFGVNVIIRGRDTNRVEAASDALRQRLRGGPQISVDS